MAKETTAQNSPEQPTEHPCTHSGPAENNTEVPTQGAPDARPKEIGGPKGPEPTRYGTEWEKNGRCIDF